MGERNYLVEGVSGTGKTSVCRELQRRGIHAINGDRELAYRGDPTTGEPVDEPSHWHHVWREDEVRRLAGDRSHRATYFCGGSRNFTSFVDVFDRVFVLEVDTDTLNQRLDDRPDEYGHAGEERALVLRLHESGEDTPQDATRIDATRALTDVVDEILRLSE